jgi:hypothetical protein
MTCGCTAYRVVKAKAHKALHGTSVEDSLTDTSEEDAFNSEDDSDDELRTASGSDRTSAAHAASYVEKQLIDELRQKGSRSLQRRSCLLLCPRTVSVYLYAMLQ